MRASSPLWSCLTGDEDLLPQNCHRPAEVLALLSTLVIAAMKLKDACSLEGKPWKNLDSIFKSRGHHFVDKCPDSQSYGFSSSHVKMWELDYKEGWMPKNWCFRIVVLKTTFESPLDCKEVKSVNPKGNQPWTFSGRTDAEFWPDVLDSLKKTLMLGKIEGKRRRGQQRM